MIAKTHGQGKQANHEMFIKQNSFPQMKNVNNIFFNKNKPDGHTLNRQGKRKDPFECLRENNEQTKSRRGNLDDAHNRINLENVF
jgi:hypothetical protein